MAAVVPITVNLSAATVVGPEDHLVIVLGERISMMEMDRFQAAIQEQLPKLAGRVLIIDGHDINTYVVRKGETDDVPAERVSELAESSDGGSPAGSDGQ